MQYDVLPSQRLIFRLLENHPPPANKMTVRFVNLLHVHYGHYLANIHSICYTIDIIRPTSTLFVDPNAIYYHHQVISSYLIQIHQDEARHTSENMVSL